MLQTRHFEKNPKKPRHFVRKKGGYQREGELWTCQGRHTSLLLEGETFLGGGLAPLNTIEMSWGRWCWLWEPGMLEGWLWLFSGLHVPQNWVFCCMWMRIHPQTPYIFALFCVEVLDSRLFSSVLWIETAWTFFQLFRFLLNLVQESANNMKNVVSIFWLYRRCRNDYVPSLFKGPGDGFKID